MAIKTVSNKVPGLQSTTFKNFRGMNRTSSRLNMSPEFAYDILNGYIKKDVKTGLGVIRQRSGVTKYNTVTFTNDCKYVFEAKWDSGGKDVIIREGTRWAKFDGVDTFANLDTGRTDGARGQAVMFGNELIMVDGGVPRKATAAYAVSDLSSDANMPQDATAVHVHQHKVWLNSAANPMKAYFCKSDSANGATSWTGTTDAGSLDFSRILPSGDTLIGFKTFSETFMVFIFKKHVVVYSCGTDPSAFAIQQIIPLNCISAHGIAQIGNDLAVPSLEGVNSFRSSLSSQDLDLDDLTKYIGPLYREILAELSDLSLVSAGFSHNLNHYYICVPSATHQILVYSLDIQNFVGRWTGYEAHSFCELEDGTMLAGGPGYVYVMNDGTNDDGQAISFKYSFPFLYFGDPNRNKAARQFEGIISHDSQQASFQFNFDYWYGTGGARTYTNTKSITLSSDAAYYRTALYRASYYRASGNTRFETSDIIGRGKQIAIDMYHSVSDSIVEIPYFTVRFFYENSKIR
jgi:hypothetical protein